MSIKTFVAASAFALSLCAFAADVQVNWPVPALPKDSNSATFAVPRNDWMQKFDRNCKRAQQGGVDLLFQGDSITEGWGGGGKDVWQASYGKLNAASFGISGDRTENILWRLRNGELDGISPKLIVLMAGTNNCGRNSAAEIADGVKEIVKEMRARCPSSRILLLAVFPRGEKASDPVRAKLAEASELFSSVADGKNVVYLDIGKAFLSEDGTLSKDIMPDFLHPNAKGYKIWASQIQPEVDKVFGQGSGK